MDAGKFDAGFGFDFGESFGLELVVEHSGGAWRFAAEGFPGRPVGEQGGAEGGAVAERFGAFVDPLGDIVLAGEVIVGGCEDGGWGLRPMLR